MSLCYIIITAIAALAFIGLFYAAVKGRKPSSILSISQIKTKFQSERDWINFCAIFVLPCIIAYNFFAWIAHGIGAVGEFLVFIALKIRWVLLWIWNEIIIAVCYSLLKLAAHYIVYIAWKLFQFACVTLKEAYKKQFIGTACKQMAILVAVLLLIYCVFIFFPYQIVLNFGIFIFILVAQFIIFKAASVFRSEQFSSNSAHASYKTFAIWVIGALCFVTLAILLQQFSSYTIVQSISITLAQIITPFIILFGVAIIGAAVFLPAYIAENGEDFSIIDFIKAFGIRIPKFIASLPFVGFGAIVATIIPVIITLVLYSGIETISQSTVQEYANETKVLYTKNHKKIESAQTLNTLTNTRDSIAQAYEQSIKAAQENLRTAELAKSIIKHNSIHTYTGNVYEGDTQYFTIPLMDGVHSYTWQISDVESETVILNTKTGVQGTSKSTGFSTIWQQAGTFVVTLETQDGNTIQTAVTVLPKAKKTKEETRPHYFVTIEEANKAIANTTTEIEIAKTLQKSEIEAFNKQIESMKTTTKTEFGAILPWFLSSIGYALLLIGLLVMAFIYKVIFFFDLYNYMQQPQYYFQKLYDKLKAKNANQPLLGIFALLCAAALCYVHCTYCC